MDALLLQKLAYRYLELLYDRCLGPYFYSDIAFWAARQPEVREWDHEHYSMFVDIVHAKIRQYIEDQLQMAYLNIPEDLPKP